MHSQHADVETDPAQPQPSTSATATGPALRKDETKDGWKKVERKRIGKRKEKRGRKRKRGERLIKDEAGASCDRLQRRVQGCQAAKGTETKKEEKTRCVSSAVEGGTGMEADNGLYSATTLLVTAQAASRRFHVDMTVRTGFGLNTSP
jgi:hypothetical protein